MGDTKRRGAVPDDRQNLGDRERRQPIVSIGTAYNANRKPTENMASTAGG